MPKTIGAGKERPTTRIGFVACYKGQKVASASSLKELAGRKSVTKLLGDKDLLIKHDIPEGLIAIY